jgi:hypothetical protein
MTLALQEFAGWRHLRQEAATRRGRKTPVEESHEKSHRQRGLEEYQGGTGIHARRSTSDDQLSGGAGRSVRARRRRVLLQTRYDDKSLVHWLRTATAGFLPTMSGSAARPQGEIGTNVFVLWVEARAPGHDELRACLSF